MTLREITEHNLDEILELSVRPEQQRYVATNAKSIAQAHYYREAWFRGVYTDTTPVGFLMLYDPSLGDGSREETHYFLWRFMIDQRHQGRGYGRRALELLVEHVKTRPHAHELLSSFVPGPDSPRDFYLRFGFELTGKEHDGELEIRLAL